MPLDTSSARGLLLSRVLPDGQWLAGSGPRVSSCCADADACQAGDLFVALDEQAFVTQSAVDRAAQRGAVGIMAERALPSALPQFIVDDIRLSFGELCHALVDRPCQSLRTIGITGSYGKTTTEYLLSAILAAAGENTHNLAAPLIDQHGARYVADQLALGRTAGCSHAIIEASSDALATKRLSGVELDAAVITNIRREHAEQHGSTQNYQRAKRQILQHLKPDGFAVVNVDDPFSQRMLCQIEQATLTIGINSEAEITGRLLERCPSEQTFLLDAGNESIVVRTQIIGDAHIYNCLSAAAAALVLGVDLSAIVHGLEAVTSIPNRLQRVECGQNFSVYVDSSATPRALANALQTLRQVGTGNLICLMGIDALLEEAARAEIGRTLEHFADRSVLTGQQLDRKLSLRNAHDVLDGFERPAQAHLMPSRAKAICWALSQARPGDVVLLAGGRETLGPDDVLLSDEDVARYWLQNNSAPGYCPWMPA